ncbi:MAG TPA: gamma-glutamyltransferase [Bryobacteraceae bacterium]|nr:gamma-glutamyltransferase [Bryobacteraceae bacterium]
MRVLASLLVVCGLLFAREPVRFRHGMVVAQEQNAADVGAAILKNGGNAVDAAVGVALALAVTHPTAGNLGGGGFLLLRKATGETAFFDFREKAPLAATRDMYLGPDGKPTRDSIEGWRAAGVPGTVRGLEMAHRKFGKREWAELVQPAVRLAADGYEVSYGQARSMRNSKMLTKFPESRRIFQRDGVFIEPGERLYQPELSTTLRRIAAHGAKGFYEGETARILAEEMRRNGGLITEEDLRQYEAVERKPLLGSYKGFEIITAPPPSSGGLGLLQILAILDGTGYEKTGFESAQTIHWEAEAMRRYYADRSEFLGDPDFFNVPSKGLLDPRYIDKLRASIDPARASTSVEIKPGTPRDYESAETTHFSIVDAEGSTVSMTYTINGSFGCGVTVPGLGFLLNNEMDDFAAKPGEPNMFGLVQGESNAVAPKKRPLSSMTPTIIAKDGKPYLVVGAPGGSRIITGVTQVILNVLDFGMNVQEAIDAPRLHHQWLPDKLMLEKGFSPDTIALLQARGHTVDQIESVAVVEAIRLNGEWLEGGTDGRGRGKVAGH